MAGKSKILIIGGTGYIGKHIVEASVKAGHPTFVLVRESTLSASSPKSNIINHFKTLAVQFLTGDLEDPNSLCDAIKQVDIVISAVGQGQILNQLNIIHAIKQTANIKRFFPSEFGLDVDRVTGVELLKAALEEKVKIRRAIEAEGIPYTYVSSNSFAGYYLANLSQIGALAPPRDKVVIFGDGNAKAIFNKEEDIGRYTIKAVDDPRTLNKILYIRPPQNNYSMNDVVSLWEKKIGITLERIYIPEGQLLNSIQEAEFPVNVIYAMAHSVWVKGVQTNFEIQQSFGVEASQLYPDINYTTVDRYLDAFV